MRHPPVTTLRAFARGDAETSSMAEHLERCASCHAVVAQARVLITAAAATPAAPNGVLERVLARRAAGERVILPLGDSGVQRQGLRRALPWAVATLLGAAGIAAAMPGSPLREWLTPRHAAVPIAAPSRPAVPQPVVPPLDSVTAGVSIPAADSLWISVASLGSGADLMIRILERPVLEVRAIGAATSTTFSPRPNGVAISDVSGGVLRVEVPARARAFDLRVGSVLYLRRRGEMLRVFARADTAGIDIVFRGR